MTVSVLLVLWSVSPIMDTRLFRTLAAVALVTTCASVASLFFNSSIIPLLVVSVLNKVFSDNLRLPRLIDKLLSRDTTYKFCGAIGLAVE